MQTFFFIYISANYYRNIKKTKFGNNLRTWFFLKSNNLSANPNIFNLVYMYTFGDGGVHLRGCMVPLFLAEQQHIC